MQDLQIQQKKLVQELAEAIATGNIHLIHDLLDEDGGYIITDSKFELQETDKYGFLNWIKPLMEDRGLDFENKLTYNFDQCMHCQIGNPVILFDEGRFPVATKESWEKEKLGLMIEFEGEKISGISICGSFLHRDNPYNFEESCRKKYGYIKNKS